MKKAPSNLHESLTQDVRLRMKQSLHQIRLTIPTRKIKKYPYGRLPHLRNSSLPGCSNLAPFSQQHLSRLSTMRTKRGFFFQRVSRLGQFQTHE